MLENSKVYFSGEYTFSQIFGLSVMYAIFFGMTFFVSLRSILPFFMFLNVVLFFIIYATKTKILVDLESRTVQIPKSMARVHLSSRGIESTIAVRTNIYCVSLGKRGSASINYIFALSNIKSIRVVLRKDVCMSNRFEQSAVTGIGSTLVEVIFKDPIVHAKDISPLHEISEQLPLEKLGKIYVAVASPKLFSEYVRPFI